MGKQVSFDVSSSDYQLIRKITARAVAAAAEHGVRLNKLDTEMDLTATHANGCPLDLERLLAADDFNLSHDVCGIARHLNRKTGRLDGRFFPRFARRQSAAA